MGKEEILKRLPRIKFPDRRAGKHVIPQASSGEAGVQNEAAKFPFISGATSLQNKIVGGQASIQPRRTPVTEQEIEAILLGGCLV